MNEFFQKLQIQASDFLTGSRPESYVHKMQLYLLIVTLVVTTFVLSYPFLTGKGLNLTPGSEWAIGKNAPDSVVAATNIEYQRKLQLEIDQKQARNSAPLHFIRDYAVLGQPDQSNEGDDNPEKESNKDSGKKKTFRDYFAEDLNALSICKKKYNAISQVRYCVRSTVPRWKNLSSRRLDTILRNPESVVRQRMEQVINILFQKYVIIKEPVNEPVFSGGTILVRDINSGVEIVTQSLPYSSVLERKHISLPGTSDAFNETVSSRVSGITDDFRKALVYAASRYMYLIHGSAYDREATQEARDEAEKRVVIPVAKISRGDMIIQKGEVITDEKLEALNNYNQARNLDKIRRLISISLQQILLVGLILYFAFNFGFRRLNDVSSNLIIFIVIWIFAGTVFILNSIWYDDVTHNEVNHIFGSWVPIGLFVVLLSTIFGEILTIPLAIYLSFLVFVGSKYDPASFIVSISMAMTGSILGARIKKRVDFITTSLIITGVGFLTLTAGYLYGNLPVLGTFSGFGLLSSNYADALRVTFFSGISTVFVIALLPMFESLFNVPTRFKLQEISDPSNPLLQELFRKAPSTWTHTLMVAAMSERACERLNLNVLLVRAGTYYHDIGKMKNPGFFIENQHLTPRPENVDQNNPDRAAKVIINHVLDGVEMARAARLPREIIAFIPEHHGTSTMSFFYHKALEKKRRSVNRDNFRYPGPRPQSKETAIVMLADSIEAASRSLEILSEKSVQDLIQKIFQLKIAENQLDESGLTMGDMEEIKGAFLEIILSSYHNRPRYPDSDHTRQLELKRSQRKKSAVKKTSGKKTSPGRSKKGNG